MDDSPALTDVSEIAETPDFDRSDLMDGLTLETPEQPDTTRRVLWSDKRSGKGALPRPSAGALGWSDNRVRKRQRADRDRDIGSTRSRLPGGCDEDDSDYEDSDDERSSPRKLKYKKPKEQMGWFHYIISAVSANPDAPIILSYYIQLLVDGFLASLLLWVAWCAFSSARGEVIYSAEKAKTAMLEEITQCRRQFLDNKCSPISSRMPALESLCNEWDACMNQDPDNVAGVKASVGHLADIINEFTTRLSWKSIVSFPRDHESAQLVYTNIGSVCHSDGRCRRVVRQQHGFQQASAERARFQPSPTACRPGSLTACPWIPLVPGEVESGLHLRSYRPNASASEAHLFRGH